MIVKIVTLFLIAMAVLAMFGRLRVRRTRSRDDKRLTAVKCRRCGQYRIGDGPCDCARRGP